MGRGGADHDVDDALERLAEVRIDLALRARWAGWRPGQHGLRAADLVDAEHAVLVAAEHVLRAGGGAGRRTAAGGDGARGVVVDLRDVVRHRVGNDHLRTVEYRTGALVVLQRVVDVTDAAAGYDRGAAAERGEPERPGAR